MLIFIRCFGKCAAKRLRHIRLLDPVATIHVDIRDVRSRFHFFAAVLRNSSTLRFRRNKGARFSTLLRSCMGETTSSSSFAHILFISRVLRMPRRFLVLIDRHDQ